MTKRESFLTVLGIIFCLVAPFKVEAAKCVSGFKIKECKTVFGDKPFLKPEVQNTRGRLIDRKLQIHNHFSNKIFVSFAQEGKLQATRKNIFGKKSGKGREKTQQTKGWLTIAASSTSTVDLPQSWNYIGIWSDEPIYDSVYTSKNHEYLIGRDYKKSLFPQVKLPEKKIQFCYPVTPPGGKNFNQKYVIKGFPTRKLSAPWSGAINDDCPYHVHYKNDGKQYSEHTGFYYHIQSDTIHVGR